MSLRRRWLADLGATLTRPAGACTCPAGLKGKHRCRHSAAALLLTA